MTTLALIVSDWFYDEVMRHEPVGVDAELAAGDALLVAGRGDQLPGQDGGLAGGDHPADGIPAVDVEDHIIEVAAGPFRRAVQLGDVPGADLVRAGR
jgi:hypothetical protein